MNSNEKREAELYNDICHLLLILQTLKTIGPDHAAYESIREKKEKAYNSLLSALCSMTSLKKELTTLSSELIKATQDSPEAHRLATTLHSLIKGIKR